MKASVGDGRREGDVALRDREFYCKAHIPVPVVLIWPIQPSLTLLDVKFFI